MEFFDSKKVEKIKDALITIQNTRLNDLIRRGDAIKAFDDHIGWGAPRLAIMNIPAVKQPITAIEYERARARRLKWCNSRPCYSCEYYLYCNNEGNNSPEYKVTLVENWLHDHPEGSED